MNEGAIYLHFDEDGNLIDVLEYRREYLFDTMPYVQFNSEKYGTLLGLPMSVFTLLQKHGAITESDREVADEMLRLMGGKLHDSD